MKNIRVNIFLSGIAVLAVAFLAANTTFAQDATAKVPGDKCIECHQDSEMMPEGFVPEDVHMQAGLSCAGCHGGNPAAEDPDEAMSARNGFVGVPAAAQIPQFCGKCHSDINIMRTYQPRIATDQEQQYYTSVHGKQLKKGDTKVATCVSCHTAHQIYPVRDTRSSVYPLNVPNTCKTCHSDETHMKSYNLPVDQYEKFASSVHGISLLENGDIGAPACNDCHGNHGATPPGVASISHVCGNCHVNNMNYFSSSPMAEPFHQSEIHACEQCHGYHDVQKTNVNMVGSGESSVCIQCHSEGDAGFVAAEKMHQSITDLMQSYARAEKLLEQVRQKGMDDMDIVYMLQEANQNLIHSRTLVHTFDPEKVGEKTSEGIKLSGNAVELALQQIKEYSTRTRGFGLAVVFIFILALATFLKIKDMEKKRKLDASAK